MCFTIFKKWISRGDYLPNPVWLKLGYTAPKIGVTYTDLAMKNILCGVFDLHIDNIHK